MQHKILAYVVRQADGQRELLVCEHRGDPEAGVQVIAGTVEPGEAVEATLWREIDEETGLTRDRVHLVRKLGEAAGNLPDVLWHAFELVPIGAVADQWSHTVGGEGEDKGMVFDYSWVRLSPQLELAGAHATFLPKLSRS